MRCVNDPELTLPHSRLHQRAFVLVPLLELAAGLVHPTLGSLHTLSTHIKDQPIEMLP
jgi:2-amino-4-hydroxy-6-hydroxymethyldihydropteridine diphosphokinase